MCLNVVHVSPNAESIPSGIPVIVLDAPLFIIQMFLAWVGLGGDGPPTVGNIFIALAAASLLVRTGELYFHFHFIYFLYPQQGEIHIHTWHLKTLGH